MTELLTEGGSATSLFGEGGWTEFAGRSWKSAFITPDMAKEILDLRNSQNRNPSERNITKFARDMAANKWRTGNGESIKFKSDETLADGQNRLFAVVRAQTLNPEFMGLPFVLCKGVDDEDVSTIDTGRSRTFGDVLKLDGEINTYQLSAAVNSLYYYKHPEREHSASERPTHEELKVFFAEHEAIRNHVNEGARISANADLSRPSAVAVAYEVQRLHGVDFDVWVDFREKLITGYNIESGEPVGALRNFGLQGTVKLKPGNRAYRNDTMIGMAKAWNATLGGKELRRIKVLDNEEVPTIA